MFGRCCYSVHGYYFHNSWQDRSAEPLSPAPAFREEAEAEVLGHFDFRIECKLQHGVHAKVWLLVNEIHSQNTLTRRAPGHTYCRTLFHRRRCLGGGGFRREWFVMQELLGYSG